MPIDKEALLDAVKTLAEVKQMRVTVKESLKGSLIVAGSALAGGLILGPLGLAVGGIAGSLVASYKATNSFKSVVAVMQEDMTPEQLDRLANNLRRAVENVGIEDVVTLTMLLSSRGNLEQVLVKELVSYLGSELNLSIARS